MVAQYLTSISITFINKNWLTDLDFDYPFTTASVDNAVVALIAYLATRLPCLRQPALGWRVFVRVVVPVGVCTALDIGFSNWSLVFISVSAHTVVKGSVPAFVLLFDRIVRLGRAFVGPLLGWLPLPADCRECLGSGKSCKPWSLGLSLRLVGIIVYCRDHNFCRDNTESPLR